MMMMQRTSSVAHDDLMNHENNAKEIHLVLSSKRKHRIKVFDDVIFEVENKYELVKPIGSGTYGVVCSSIDRVTNEKFAIKKVTDVLKNSEEAMKVLRELIILRHIRHHENVITLEHVMIPTSKHTFNDIYMVFELMDYDLHTVIHSGMPLSDEHIKYFMFQLLKGLSYLHSANIVHCDLKPGNLLVNNNCDLKICDFGLARTTKGQAQPLTECLVTLWYRAPELLLECDTYGASIDMWSVGCIFAELLGREALFPGENEQDQLDQIISILGIEHDTDLGFVTNSEALGLLKSWPHTPCTDLWQLLPTANIMALDLLQKMLAFDPNKRITAEEALQHPYMAGCSDLGLTRPAPFPCDVGADADDGVIKIRNLIYDEMLLYHPETAPYLSLVRPKTMAYKLMNWNVLIHGL